MLQHEYYSLMCILYIYIYIYIYICIYIYISIHIHQWCLRHGDGESDWFILDSFRTGSGQTGSPQKCRDIKIISWINNLPTTDYRKRNTGTARRSVLAQPT